MNDQKLPGGRYVPYPSDYECLTVLKDAGIIPGMREYEAFVRTSPVEERPTRLLRISPKLKFLIMAAQRRS